MDVLPHDWPGSPDRQSSSERPGCSVVGTVDHH